ncbi:NrdH-redoxin [Sorangium atrum]|uniref:NrdH-redoxin n=1 Tax=Sorangium atrum TaxID=2995308 RepID=A0ABT5CGE0_9BACT|nr:NrdH-redoxin [Sorangium aterium]MDC0685452.1 NrdH-redoxin [Sorangium aterium]
MRQPLCMRPAVVVRALVMCALAFSLLWSDSGRAAPIEPRADVELFAREGCPRCDEAKRFVAELEGRRPGLRAIVSDVVEDRTALDRLRAIAEGQSTAAVSVPAFYVRGVLVVGYAGRDATGRHIEALLDNAPPPPTAAGEPAASCPLTPPTPSTSEQPPCPVDGAGPSAGVVDVPVFGRLDVRDLGLPAFTVLLGLVDGFNPCATWVLLFLLSFLATLRSRAKMLLIAGVFVLVSGLAYFAFMAAWLNFFLLVGASRAAQIALGAIAVLAGSVHVKDFFAWKRGVSLSIPESVKPGIYARMRAVVRAESLPAALAAACLLAVMVNVVELLCTAGLPALYTQLLVEKRLPAWKHYAYLGLYNVAYMADDMVMVGVAVVTLSRRRLQEKEGRWLKLLSGAIMVLLGLLLLFKPTWLAT